MGSRGRGCLGYSLLPRTESSLVPRGGRDSCLPLLTPQGVDRPPVRLGVPQEGGPASSLRPWRHMKAELKCKARLGRPSGGSGPTPVIPDILSGIN